MPIRSPIELKNVLYNLTEHVLDEVSEKLWEKLIENIDDIVYSQSNNIYYANGSGEPTFQFKDSWIVEEQNTGNEVRRVIKQDYSKMSSDSGNFVHGSNYYSSKDAREWLAYYINEGKSGPLFGEGHWASARPFFTETQKLIENGTIDKWIKETYRKYGVQIR